MAYAGFRFAEKLIRALNGQSGIVEPTFVYLPGVEGGAEIAKITGCEFFSVPVELGVSIPLLFAVVVNFLCTDLYE
jgi:malate dehydrogenase